MKCARVALLVCAAAAACAARAQFFRVGFGGAGRQMQDFSATMRLEPSNAVVGVPCEMVFSFTTGNKIEVQRVSGLPDSGVEYLARALEPHSDGTYRLPMRFTEPLKTTLKVEIEGMQTVEEGNGTSFRTSFSSNFRKTLPPVAIDVRPLPESGRPEGFSGAVGSRFRLVQSVSSDHVRPGDLITATYELVYDGYCPSNVWPRIERLSGEFKSYEPKEVSRGPGRVKWTQALVPRTTAATNTALVSVSYYNSRLRRYEVARAQPLKLVFVSDQAASTESASVTVAGGGVPAPDDAKGDPSAIPLELRFAPSQTSPVVATLPPGVPFRRLATVNGWLRVETPQAVGWTRDPAAARGK